MAKIRFLGNPKIPNDMVDEWGDYVKDSVHDVSLDEANRWISRGVAEIVTSSVSRRINLEKEEETETKVEKEKVKESETIASVGTVSTTGTAAQS